MPDFLLYNCIIYKLKEGGKIKACSCPKKMTKILNSSILSEHFDFTDYWMWWKSLITLVQKRYMWCHCWPGSLKCQNQRIWHKMSILHIVIISISLTQKRYFTHRNIFVRDIMQLHVTFLWLRLLVIFKGKSKNIWLFCSFVLNTNSLKA